MGWSSVSIALELGGLINVVYGGWIAFLGAILAFVGTKLMIMDKPPTLAQAVAKPALEILAVSVTMAVAMFAAAFALEQRRCRRVRDASSRSSATAVIVLYPRRRDGLVVAPFPSGTSAC